jgi:hypothetical protein
MFAAGSLFLAMAFAAAELPSWTFDTPDAGAAWAPNAHLANVAVQNGVLAANGTDWDPFFLCSGLSFPTSPWQYVVIRIKADQPGSGELFFTGTEEGQYGGFSQDRSRRFRVEGDAAFHDIVVFPFWQAEGQIVKLRLDLYDGAHFEIDSITVQQWGDADNPVTGQYAWEFADDDAWRIADAEDERFSPPLRLPIEGRGWATIEIQSERDTVGTLLWAVEGIPGLQSESFSIRGGEQPRAYNLELDGNKAWTGTMLALGLRLEDPSTTVRAISIGEEPGGPAELAVTYFGFENGINRAGADCNVLLRVTNLGGRNQGIRGVHFEPGDGIEIVDEPDALSEDGLSHEEYADFTWAVRASAAGLHTVQAHFSGKGMLPDVATAELRFTESLGLAASDYVPEPRPVKTAIEVAAYYFPGWDSPAKWDLVHRVAPIRKPLLGYYDESNPECVDWQIKWAVENGITVFLVDWYWVKGNQHLTHWFEAYKKSRYRDSLKVVIMWANHNPPDTHSREDWRNVTQEWIDQYFGMESYYRIDGKPALFLWDPRNLRNDLGGSDGAKAALDDSQQMARDAGYEGIEFVAVNTAESPAFVEMLAAEGYAGATNYHEWGKATDSMLRPQRARFEDVVATAPGEWARRDAMCKPLTYYPLVDTGWDSRPWHGENSLAIEGRTSALFEQLLREAKAFCEAHGKSVVILGPVNEWGEGSYIEPCTEYGFAMLEAVRAVFAMGDPASWPVNVAPTDVGRGPYDYPPFEPVTTWEFDADAGGWRTMMNAGEFRVEDGALRFTALGSDPAIVVPLTGVNASNFGTAEVTMQVSGKEPAGMGAQLFWSRGGNGTSESASMAVPLETDGGMHTYVFDLRANSRWRGPISMLRFDPCNAADVEIAVDAFRLR